jgi:hypothetical protein
MKRVNWRATTRKGETRALKAELHLWDYRYLRWWGLTHDQAANRLKLNGLVALGLQAQVEADPALHPSLWVMDLVMEADLELWEDDLAAFDGSTDETYDRSRI